MPKTEDGAVEDTSTNEEALSVEKELEDSEVSFDDFDDDDADESDEEESEESEGSDESEGSEEDEQASESDEGSEEESDEDEGNQSQEEDSEGEGTASEEDTKRHNAEMAQKRIADKQARDAEKARQQQKYLDEATDDDNRALRQLQIDSYNNKIESNNNKLDNGIDKAVASIDLFRTGSEAAKKELADSLDDFEAMYVRRDVNGDPIEVKGDVYAFLQKKADSIRRLQQDGALKEVKDKKVTKTRTDIVPSRTPKEKVDPDMDAFDEEAARW